MDRERELRDVALARFQLIGPLLEPGLDPARWRQIRRDILARTDATGKPVISERTLRRHLQAYRTHGFAGLLPRRRKDAGQLRAMSPELLNEAIRLKQELPTRSMEDIRLILVSENWPGAEKLKPSTLARYLATRLASLPPTAQPESRRRFQREHRNELWQADLKYGPYLPDPRQPGRKVRTYLLSFIDDYSRLITHAQFYVDQRQPIIEDCLRKAILKRGVPDRVYVDNGKIFVSHWFQVACARLNIRHLRAAPYDPAAKGKIERWMRTVDSFLAELALVQVSTLEELNQRFWIWLEEHYNHGPHSAWGGKSPVAVFDADQAKPLRLVYVDDLREAFLWEETRRTDATGCFKLKGALYDAGPELARLTVAVRFDPFDLERVEVWYKGQKVTTARKLELTRKPAVTHRQPPPTESAASPTGSRLLEALEKKAQERRQRRLGAISFRDLSPTTDGGNGHV